MPDQTPATELLDHADQLLAAEQDRKRLAALINATREALHLPADGDPNAIPHPAPKPGVPAADRSGKRSRRPATMTEIHIFDEKSSAAVRTLLDEIDQQRARAEAAEHERDQLAAELARLDADRHKLAQPAEIRAVYDQARDGFAKERDRLTAELRSFQTHHAELHTRINATENDLRSANRAVQEFAALADQTAPQDTEP